MDRRFIGDPGFEILENNPFLELLEGLAPQQQQPGIPAQNVFQPGRFNFKLPEYWDHAPGMWFAQAEFGFETAGILTERQRFGYAIDALGYESLKLVNDLLLQPPPDRPYSVLKERLLLASQLTAVQMAEKVMKMPDLGDRRPSQLLAAMLEFCPPGQQASPFFRAAFLTRLPSSIRSHLDEMEEGDLKILAAKADRQWLNCGGAAAIAAVGAAEAGDDSSEEFDVCAAVKPSGGGKNWRQKKPAGADKKKESGKGGGGGKEEWAAMTTVCARHAKFGERAYSCGNPKQCKFGKPGN